MFGNQWHDVDIELLRKIYADLPTRIVAKALRMSISSVYGKAKQLDQMRQALMDTLKDLRNRDNPMEPDRARAIAQVASVMVDSAKVEVDYCKATQQDASGFFSPASGDDTKQIGSGTVQNLPGGITRHRIGG